MSVIHESNGKMTRYGLDGSIVAVALLMGDGWVITDPAGNRAEGIPSTSQAHEQLAKWDSAEAARETVRSAAAACQAARRQLEEAIRHAGACGVPQTQIAEDSGFSRQWVRHLLRPQPGDTGHPTAAP
jgi:hypothetical protein